MRSSSRSHCTTAPPMKTEPSSAYSRPSPRSHATVVRSRLLRRHRLRPVNSRQKQPVPYVTFTAARLQARLAQQRRLLVAEHAADGDLRAKEARARSVPNHEAEGRTSGRIAAGMPRAERISGSHAPRWMSKSIVRDAFDGSRQMLARQLAQQPRVHRAEAHVSRVRLLRAARGCSPAPT